MAALHGGCSDFFDKCSGDTEEEYLGTHALPTQPNKASPDSASVTTVVLKTLLAELQKNILTDITALQADLQGLTGRMRTLEDTSATKEIKNILLRNKRRLLRDMDIIWIF
ncbi:Hypothetical predicted protein [Pelobates cultripes]|uniref:Uncharacterized protein n=1 Tax=Pelobates cultripes TaxID=61616 RepID=A0AAD1SL35_PELCU|nr:Hypothetical predicted protein [Pelobates cultripes]CAH2301847.1 Hypothetical predicted protein [Pelobates cultripes]